MEGFHIFSRLEKWFGFKLPNHAMRQNAIFALRLHAALRLTGLGWNLDVDAN